MVPALPLRIQIHHAHALPHLGQAGTARLTVVVVLPTPPFWLAMQKFFTMDRPFIYVDQSPPGRPKATEAPSGGSAAHEVTSVGGHMSRRVKTQAEADEAEAACSTRSRAAGRPGGR